jgi:hypothetical protein
MYVNLAKSQPTADRGRGLARLTYISESKSVRLSVAGVSRQLFALANTFRLLPATIANFPSACSLALRFSFPEKFPYRFFLFQQVHAK